MPMNPQLARSRPSEAGSVLTITLFITVMFGLFLGSYLSLARHQNALVARSQVWNAAMGLAEAGVEEALAQLNPGAPPPVIDRAANGWGGPSGGIYGPVKRTLPTGSYSVLLTADAFPIIYATGYVTIPSLSATLSRVVRVTTTNAPLFSAGLVGIYGINFNGNGVGSDSFNSARTNLSTGGQYDPLKTSTNGDVASVFGIVNVGNGDVKGNVYLGPNATNELSKNGTITGGVSNDFNVEFERVVLPQGTVSWLPPLAGSTTISNTTYKYVFGYPGSPNGSGDYALDGSLLSSANIYVGTNAKVRLVVTGSASPSSIRVAGAGTNAGHMTFYMDGPSFSMSGTARVDGGNAANFAYYGTTNNTKITLGGNSAFVGTLYAPQADLKLSGGGSSTSDFSGAILARTVSLTGHYLFHFDENLLTAGPKRGLVVNSWQEL
jgi:hypothetical protein